MQKQSGFGEEIRKRVIVRPEDWKEFSEVTETMRDALTGNGVAINTKSLNKLSVLFTGKRIAKKKEMLNIINIMNQKESTIGKACFAHNYALAEKLFGGSSRYLAAVLFNSIMVKDGCPPLIADQREYNSLLSFVKYRGYSTEANSWLRDIYHKSITI